MVPVPTAILAVVVMWMLQPERQAQLEVWSALAGLLILAVAALSLPAAVRRAERAIRLCRQPEQLELLDKTVSV